MDDRIKLAEAMGWNNITDKHLDADTNLYVLGGFPPNTRSYGVRSPLPDPENDANDDYAVLEWMQNHEHPEWFVDELRGDDKNLSPWHYLIGDYARAAVLVLDRQTRNSRKA